MKKLLKYIKPTLLFTVFIIASSLLVYHTDAEKIALFEPVGLFTYVGVLLGFAITIYKFTLSLVDNIKESIQKLTELNDETKEQLIAQLMRGFKEMKENIMLLFVGLVVITIFAMLALIENPYMNDVSRFQIPEIALLSTFFFCTYSIYDLMRTLFNISEVKLILVQAKPKKPGDVAGQDIEGIKKD